MLIVDMHNTSDTRSFINFHNQHCVIYSSVESNINSLNTVRILVGCKSSQLDFHVLESLHCCTLIRYSTGVKIRGRQSIIVFWLIRDWARRTRTSHSLTHRVRGPHPAGQRPCCYFIFAVIDRLMMFSFFWSVEWDGQCFHCNQYLCCGNNKIIPETK